MIPLDDLFHRLQSEDGDPVFDPGAILEDIASRTKEEELQFRQHPLGFWLADIPSPVPDGRSRVHVWPEDYQMRGDQQGTIHTHTWELRSAVVAGTIRNLSHQLTDGGNFDVSRVEYQLPDRTQLIPVRRKVTPVVSHVSETRAGQVYGELAGDYHSTELKTAPAVTVVLAIPRTDVAHVLVAGGVDIRQDPVVRDIVPTREVLSTLISTAAY